jgi:hypothetical protein
MTAAEAWRIIGGRGGRLIEIWGRAGLGGVGSLCISGMADCIRGKPGRVGESVSLAAVEGPARGCVDCGAAERPRCIGAGREAMAALLSGN